MLRIAVLFVFLSATVLGTAQSDTIFEHTIQLGNDDADQIDSTVSLTDLSLTVGVSQGERSRFAARFRNVPMEPEQVVTDARLRFVVQSDSVEELQVKIALESNTAPEAYASESYNLSRRETFDNAIFWSIRDKVKGDTLVSPNLSNLVNAMVDIQVPGRVFADLSFIVSPDLSVNINSVNELNVYSSNQFDLQRAPFFYMSATGFTGIESPAQSGLSVYPNPAHDLLNIEWNAFRITDIQLFSAAGEEIELSGDWQATPGTSLQIPLRDSNGFGLKKGIYYLRVQSEQETSVAKVMVR